MNRDAAAREKLFRSARQGSQYALRQLLGGYRAYLTLLARLRSDHRSCGAVDPCRFVEETFAAAERCFGDFRGTTQEQLLDWLEKIMASKLPQSNWTYVRSAELERDAPRTDPASSASIPAGGGIATQDSALSRDRGVMLAKALERLPSEQQKVLQLRHLEGLRFSEIAERMAHSLEDVKCLWIRALVGLKRALAAVY